MRRQTLPTLRVHAGNGSNGEAEPQKYNWGFGDSEPAHRPGSGTPHTRGLACGAATGWTYVEESELGTVVALNVGGKVVPRMHAAVLPVSCRGRVARVRVSVCVCVCVCM